MWTETLIIRIFVGQNTDTIDSCFLKIPIKLVYNIFTCMPLSTYASFISFLLMFDLVITTSYMLPDTNSPDTYCLIDCPSYFFMNFHFASFSPYDYPWFIY